MSRAVDHLVPGAAAWAYHTIAYPVLPALYIALTTAVMLLILMSPSSRQDAFLGLAIVVVGIPVYFIWRSVERPA